MFAVKVYLIFPVLFYLEIFYDYTVTTVGPVAIPHRDASADHALVGWQVLRLFALVRFVLPNEFFI